MQCDQERQGTSCNVHRKKQHDEKAPTFSRFSNISICPCNAWLSAVVSCSLCWNSRICSWTSPLDSSASVTRFKWLEFASVRCPICNAMESIVFWCRSLQRGHWHACSISLSQCNACCRAGLNSMAASAAFLLPQAILKCEPVRMSRNRSYLDLQFS